MSAGERNLRKKGSHNVKGRSDFNINSFSGGLGAAAIPYEEDILSAPRMYSSKIPEQKGGTKPAVGHNPQIQYKQYNMRSTNMLLNKPQDGGKLIGITSEESWT